jgi:histidine triad (HIT) family protein
MSSIFSRIIAGEIPSYKVYEDDRILAFLDIHPMQLGHVLVVPKEEIGDILDLPDDLYFHIMMTAKDII